MITTHTTQTTVESGTVVLRDVDIDGHKYAVVCGNLNGYFWVEFMEESSADDRGIESKAIEGGIFGIEIDQGNVRISRHLSRPNHDHDDRQYYCGEGNSFDGWTTDRKKAEKISFGAGVSDKS